MSLPTAPAYETHLGVPLPPSVTASQVRWIWGSGAIVGAAAFALAIVGFGLLSADRIVTGLAPALAAGAVFGGGVVTFRSMSLSAAEGSAAPENADDRRRIGQMLRGRVPAALLDGDRDALIRWARALAVQRELASGGPAVSTVGYVAIMFSLGAASDPVFLWIALGLSLIYVVALGVILVLRHRLVRIARLPMTVEDELPA